MSTARAILTRIRGVHGHNLPTGPCCLVRKEAGELIPRGVMNALGETMVMRHPVDRQVLHGDEVKRVHDAAAVLMGEVTAPPYNAFMDPRHDLAPSGALGCAFLLFGQATLCLRKRLFFATKE